MISNKFFERYANILAGLIIYVSVSIVYLNFPTYSKVEAYFLSIYSPEYVWGNWTNTNPVTNESHEESIGVDEFVYYHQAKVVSSKGLFHGFQFLSKEYLSDTIWNDAPHPLRLGAIMANSITVSVYDSPSSIVFFCLLNFVALLVGTYFFIKQEMNPPLALLVVLLMSVSPLEMYVAKRALMDMPSFTALVFSCYAFWLMAQKGAWKYRIAFVLLMTWTILVKEANGTAMLPFFGLFLLFMWYKKETSLSFISICSVIALPVVLTLLSYEIIVGHQNWIAIFETYFAAASHSPYSAEWGQGTWSRTLIDFILLSPFVAVLAIGFAGYVLFSQKASRFTVFVLCLGVYLVVYFNFLPKNVRYVILFDFVLRYLAASAVFLLFGIYSDSKQKMALSVLLLVLVLVDLYSFYFLFVEQNIYDPTSYILLLKRQLIAR